MLVEQELIWHLNRKDGVFSFWLSALVENNEAIALSLYSRRGIEVRVAIINE